MTRKTLVFVVLLIGLQFILARFYFSSEYFNAHDSETQPPRVLEYFRSLQKGVFIPKWAGNLLYGYGYPIFVYYPPLTYFISAVFMYMGLEVYSSINLVNIVAFVLGPVGFFYLTRNLFGPQVAGIISIIYSLIPYRAVETYVRGDLAEFFAYQLFPWILWLNFRYIADHRNSSNYLGFSGLLALLVLTHTISAFIFGLFLFGLNLYFLATKRYVWLPLIKAALLAAGLSCFFWLPLLSEIHNVRIAEMGNSDYLYPGLELKEMWASPWGYGGYRDNTRPPMSMQLGMIITGMSVAAMIMTVFLKSTYQKLFIAISVFYVCSIFLETKYSFFISSRIPILSVIQFPWRFHILSTSLAALLSGFMLWWIHRRSLKLFYVITTLAIGLSINESINFFKPSGLDGKISLSVLGSSTYANEYLPNWVIAPPTGIADRSVAFNKGEGTILSSKWDDLSKEFIVDSPQSSIMEIAHIYYPGWIAFVDDSESKISYENGLMQLSIPQGRHFVKFKFASTWWRRLSTYISLASLLWVGIMLVKPHKEIKNGSCNL